MATRTHTSPQVQHGTPVSQMPPLTVTTAGIPTAEHVDVPRVVADAPTVVSREQRTRWYALAFSGVLAVLAVCMLVWSALFGPQTPTTYPGYGAYGATMSEWPPAPLVVPAAVPVWPGQVLSEWPPRLTPSTDGYGQWGSTTSEWPPRTTPSTDGYGQWGSTLSEWPRPVA